MYLILLMKCVEVHLFMNVLYMNSVLNHMNIVYFALTAWFPPHRDSPRSSVPWQPLSRTTQWCRSCCLVLSHWAATTQPSHLMTKHAMTLMMMILTTTHFQISGKWWLTWMCELLAIYLTVKFREAALLSGK